MFRRGQKIRVIESNTRNHTHPAKGDVGYLDNMFLFPKERFILVNIFFCSYGDGDDRLERKNFVLDLGINKSTKTKISRTGVNKLFFMSKPHVNLNPTFFLIGKQPHKTKVFKLVKSFPQIMGTYGIWTGYTSVKNKMNRDSDALFRIPCGNISRCSETKSRLVVSNKEFQAWIRSILAELIPALQLFNTLYQSNGGKLNTYAMNIWHNIYLLFNLQNQYDNIQYLHLKKDQFSAINSKSRSYVIDAVMRLRNLTFLACERLIRKLIYNQQSKGSKSQVLTLKSKFGMGMAEYLIDPEFAYKNNIHVLDSVFTSECIYRALISEHDTAERLSQLHKYLPLDKWDLKQIARDADEIRTDADSDSSALNRIFDLIKPQSVSESIAGWFKQQKENPCVMVTYDDPIYSWNVTQSRITDLINDGCVEVNLDKAEPRDIHYAVGDIEFDVCENEDEEEC